MENHEFNWEKEKAEIKEMIADLVRVLKMWAAGILIGWAFDLVPKNNRYKPLLIHIKNCLQFLVEDSKRDLDQSDLK